MKNRKTVVVAFMLVAVLLMGVGYAALTDTLTIEANLKADTSVSQEEFNNDIYFSATSVISDATGNKAASQILEGRDSATITAQHFTTKGQVVKVKFTIKNDSTEFAARLTPEFLGVINSDPSHDPVFTATWSWNESTSDTSVFDLQPNDSKDLWVTITLIETPTEEHSASFTLTFTGTQVDPTTNP